MMCKHDTEKRLTGRLLASCLVQHLETIPYTHNASFQSNCGYWSIELLYNFMLPSGADVHGIIKQNEWAPFMYDKKDLEQIWISKFQDTGRKNYKTSINNTLRRNLQVGVGTAKLSTRKSLWKNRKGTIQSCQPSKKLKETWETRKYINMSKKKWADLEASWI